MENNKKEFYGSASFSGDISFSVKARNKEEAKKLIYENILLDIFSDEDETLEISDVQWDLINKEPRGNLATPFVHDIDTTEIRCKHCGKLLAKAKVG